MTQSKTTMMAKMKATVSKKKMKTRRISMAMRSLKKRTVNFPVMSLSMVMKKMKLSCLMTLNGNKTKIKPRANSSDLNKRITNKAKLRRKSS